MHRWHWLAALLVVGASASARASEGVSDDAGAERSRFARPALALHLGLGEPVGWAGLELDWAFGSRFSLAGGAGVGGYGDPQVAVTARVRAAGRRWAAGLGAGSSLGPHTWKEVVFWRDSESELPKKEWDLAFWLNAEGFVELRTHAGFLWRTTLGYGYLLNTSDGTCVVDIDHCNTEHKDDGSSIYLGFAFGYVFR